MTLQIAGSPNLVVLLTPNTDVGEVQGIFMGEPSRWR